MNQVENIFNPPIRGMSLKELREFAAQFNYAILTNQTDAFGRKWRYLRVPTAEAHGGTYCYFDTLPQVERNLQQVRIVRSWQDEMPPIKLG
jgi:hypothetical protein